MFTFNLTRPDGSVWLTVTVRAAGVTVASRAVNVPAGLVLVLV